MTALSITVCVATLHNSQTGTVSHAACATTNIVLANDEIRNQDKSVHAHGEVKLWTKSGRY